MEILCQIFSVIIATLLCYFLSANSLYLLIDRKCGITRFFILMVFYPLLLSGVTVASSIFISTAMATVIISTISFALATYAYFSLQRFSDATDQPSVIKKIPLFCPVIVFLTFVISAIAGGKLLVWYFFTFLIGIWAVLGVSCAEIAIQVYMKRSAKFGTKCDRNLAISAITAHAKGYKHMFAKRTRYPFP